MVQFPSLQTATVDDAQERTLQLEGAGGHQWRLHQKLRDEHVAQHDQIRFSRGTLSGGPWQVHATVIANFCTARKSTTSLYGSSHGEHLRRNSSGERRLLG